MLKLDFPCRCITLRSRKALQVIYDVGAPVLLAQERCEPLCVMWDNKMSYKAMDLSANKRILDMHGSGEPDFKGLI